MSSANYRTPRSQTFIPRGATGKNQPQRARDYRRRDAIKRLREALDRAR